MQGYMRNRDPTYKNSLFTIRYDPSYVAIELGAAFMARYFEYPFIASYYISVNH